MNELFQDAQQLARRQPELFVAGALATGFLVGRFFKSSSSPQGSRYNSGSSWQGSYNRGSYAQGRYGQNQSSQYSGGQYGVNTQYDSDSQSRGSSQYPYSDRYNDQYKDQYKDRTTTRQEDANTMTHDVPITESEEAYAR